MPLMLVAPAVRGAVLLVMAGTTVATCTDPLDTWVPDGPTLTVAFRTPSAAGV